MNGLIPFRRNLNLGNRDFYDLYNVFDDFFNDKWNSGKLTAPNQFKLDVQDTEKEYRVEAELPGVKKEEIEIDMMDGRLNITIQREENVDEEKKNYIHRERRYSSMNRSIYLADAKADGIKAKLDDGILSISIPKDEKVDKATKISIE